MVFGCNNMAEQERDKQILTTWEDWGPVFLSVFGVRKMKSVRGGLSRRRWNIAVVGLNGHEVGSAFHSKPYVFVKVFEIKHVVSLCRLKPSLLETVDLLE